MLVPGGELWRRFGASASDAAAKLVHGPLAAGPVLTLEEKVSLIAGFGWHEFNLAKGHYIGNIAGVPRLAIPTANMHDGPQGFRTSSKVHVGQVTSFPCALAAAATWDRQLVFDWASAIGSEFRLKGANMILGPSVNVHRVAAGGRNAEYISGEDPTLGSALTAEYVRGVQSQGVAAVVKHFILNSQEV